MTHYLFQIPVFDGTDSGVTKGIGRCVAAITPNHSFTSRRHSLAMLVRMEIDDQVQRVIAGYNGEWSRGSLAGFALSRVWKSPPALGRSAPHDWDAGEKGVFYAKQWRARVQSAIRSAQKADVGKGTSPRAERDRFCATLDTIICCIDRFSRLRPGRAPTRVRQRDRRAWTRDEFCELCWRKTEFEVAHKMKEVGRSDRFCAEHNQQNEASKSTYRRHHAHRQRFIAELDWLRSKRLGGSREPFTIVRDNTAKAGYRIHMNPVSSQSEDVRRAAYALIEHPLGKTREACLVLRASGLSTLDIAAKLDLTPRAVRLSLETAAKYLRRAELVRCGRLS